MPTRGSDFDVFEGNQVTIWRSLLIILLSTAVFAQMAPTLPTTAKPTQQVQRLAGAKDQDFTESKPPDPAPSVSPNAAVITILGFCDLAFVEPNAKTLQRPCETIVSRNDYEELAKALDPNMSPGLFRELADAYPKLLLMAHEAQNRGLDDQLRVRRVLQFMRIQRLAQEMGRELQKQSQRVSPQEVEKYYADNTSKYEEFVLRHIFIPKTKQPNAILDPALSPADDLANMNAAAEQIQRRAASGEDFDMLQKEAFAAARMAVTAPNTAIGKRTRDGLPRDHRTVFDLRPGAVSSLIEGPTGYHIYKIESRDTKPLSEVQEEIRQILEKTKFQQMTDAVTQSTSTVLNRTYFNAFEKSVEFGGPEPQEETTGMSPKPVPKAADVKQLERPTN